MALLSIHGLPLTQVTLAFHEPRLGALRILVEAFVDEGRRVDRLTSLSPRGRAYLVALEPNVVPGRFEGPVHRDLEQAAGHREGCGLSLLLRLGADLALVSFFGPEPLPRAQAALLENLQPSLSLALANALEHATLLRQQEQLADDNRFLSDELAAQAGNVVVGAEGGLWPVMERIRELAREDGPVCLEGEPGSGRSVVARALHRLSRRQGRLMLQLRCRRLAPPALERELFGAEERRGRVERAAGGTLFLDGVEAVPAELQRRILRLVLHQRMEHVGSARAFTVDVRLVLATVDRRRLAPGLREHLERATVRVPPLRERPEDIPGLLHHFLERRGAGARRLAPGTLEQLTRLRWPGNVAELQNAVEREVLVRPSGLFSFEGLFAKGLVPASEATLDLAMADHIRGVLHQCDGKVNGPGGAAERLGIHPNTLRHRMRKLGISFGRPTTKRQMRED